MKMNVLIIVEFIPEYSRLYLVPMSKDIYEKVKHAQGMYVNGFDEKDEDKNKVKAIYRILDSVNEHNDHMSSTNKYVGTWLEYRFEPKNFKTSKIDAVIKCGFIL